MPFLDRDKKINKTIEDDFAEFLELSSVEGISVFQKSYGRFKEKWFKGFRGSNYIKTVKWTDKDYDAELAGEDLNKFLSVQNQILNNLKKLDTNYSRYKIATIKMLNEHLIEARKLAKTIFLTGKNMRTIKKTTPGFFFDKEVDVIPFKIYFDKPKVLNELLSISLEVKKIINIKEWLIYDLIRGHTISATEDVAVFDKPKREELSISLESPMRKLNEKLSIEFERRKSDRFQHIEYYQDGFNPEERSFENIVRTFSQAEHFSIFNDEYFKYAISPYINDCEKFMRGIELILRRRKKQEKQSSNYGYIYVMSNEAYPNIYKIGSTYGLPEERAEELTGTGSLYPFKVEYFIDIKDAEYYEKQIHKILDISRVNKNREFFKLPLDEIKSILKKLANSSHNYDTKMKMTEIKEAISND